MGNGINNALRELDLRYRLMKNILVIEQQVGKYKQKENKRKRRIKFKERKSRVRRRRRGKGKEFEKISLCGKIYVLICIIVGIN